MNARISELSMFSGMSDAHIAHAVRMAERHYLSIGRDPLHCDVALCVLRDCDAPEQPAKPEAVRLRDELRERAAFEAWASSIGACIDADEHGNYVDSHLNSAKLGWIAAISHASSS